MKLLKREDFANGTVYVLETEDGFPIETTITHLPYETKFFTNENSNKLTNGLGDFTERLMIGISCMSGCPVRCKFCATGNLKKWRKLTAAEMLNQIDFVIKEHKVDPSIAKEFKINYTRMGEPGLMLETIKEVIETMDKKFNNVHHYVSTIGIKDIDYSWVKENVTLQFSVHSLEETRNKLIPFKNKITLSEMGKVRTESAQKTTLNLTLVNEADFNIEKLKEYFDPKFFFIKLSPINENNISKENGFDKGVIKVENLL